jgi:hypothetical protein
MDLEYARGMARRLLARHGLDGWGVTFTWRGLRLAECDEAGLVIVLSRPYVRAAQAPSVEDSVLHEIAHALVGCRHGHDELWREKCREIGARPDAEASFVEHLPFTSRCECGHVYGWETRPARGFNYFCAGCDAPLRVVHRVPSGDFGLAMLGTGFTAS